MLSDLVTCRIILVVDFVRQPSFRIIDGGRYVQESEVVRRADRDRMLHAVLPVFDEVLSEKLVFFRMDRISEITGIGDGDFFVPAFLAYDMFAFEGINTAHRDTHVGQGDAQRRILRALVDVHRGRDIDRAVGKTLRDADTRSLVVVCCIRRVQHIELIAAVAAGREIHTGRECAVRIGFHILRMRPCNSEVFRHAVIRQSFVARFRNQIRSIDRSRIFIPFPVRRAGGQAPRSFRVNLARKRQIDVIADGKIISAVTEVEAARHLVAIRGHDNP